MSADSPMALWDQADREHPDDPDRRKVRYNELMREHGHIVPKKPGESSALPCGWRPGRV